MPDTYTSNLNLTKPELGGSRDTWGQKWNTNADSLDTAIAAKAPIASPALTGTPTAPTAAVNTNTTQLATTAFVIGQASATTPAMAGTAAVGTSTRFARADHVHPTDTTRAPLASPALTGTPTAPTAAVDTNTTQLATTAYVVGQASATTPLMAGTAAVGSSTRFARADHVHPTDTTRAPVASPALTGTPTAPTAPLGTDTTQIATTAFVNAEIANDAPTKTGGGASGTWGISISGNAATATTASGLAATLPITGGGTGATTAANARTNLGLVIGTDVQAYDADLNAIAGLGGTSGFLKKTAANTWSLDTSTYLTGNQTVTLSGDLTGSGATSIATTLANSGVTAGTYNYATITVDAKGRVTSASSGGVTPAFPAGTIMIFGQTAAPTGWTKLTSVNDAALRVVSGSVVNNTGGTNFSTVFASRTPTGSVSVSGTVGSTTLTTSQIPSHRHFVFTGGGAAYTLTGSNTARSQSELGDLTGDDYNIWGDIGTATADLGLTSPTGSSGSHNHSFSGSATFTGSAMDFDVKYVDVIRASKD